MRPATCLACCLLVLSGCQLRSKGRHPRGQAHPVIRLGDGVYQEAHAVVRSVGKGTHLVVGRRTEPGLVGPHLYLVDLQVEGGQATVMAERIFAQDADGNLRPDNRPMAAALNSTRDAVFVAGNVDTEQSLADGYVYKIASVGEQLEIVAEFQFHVPPEGGPYFGTNHPNEFFNAVAPTPDGGCVVVGDLHTGINGGDVLVIRLDASLQQQWVTRIQGPGWRRAGGVHVTKPGPILVCGQLADAGGVRSVAWKLSAAGQLVSWDGTDGIPPTALTLESPGDTSLTVGASLYREEQAPIRRADEGLLVIGSTRGSGGDGLQTFTVQPPSLAGVWPPGGPSWQSSLPMIGDRAVVRGATILDDDGATLVGYTTTAPILATANRDAVLWRIDRDGNLLADPLVIDEGHEDSLAAAHDGVAAGVTAAAANGTGKQVLVVLY